MIKKIKPSTVKKKSKTKSKSKKLVFSAKKTESKKFSSSYPFTIIIDSREPVHTRYPFTNLYPTEIACLKTGDYSIKGYEDVITVERKTKSDAYQSFGHSKNRERFIKELERMTLLERACIIIECSFTEFLIPPEFVQKINGKSMINSLISWYIKYNVPFFFTENRRYSQAFVIRFFEKFWKHKDVFILSNK